MLLHKFHALSMSMCLFIQCIIRKTPWCTQCTSRSFSNRVKAASVEFGLRTGSRRLFHADGPAMATARWPYMQSQCRGTCSRIHSGERRCFWIGGQILILCVQWSWQKALDWYWKMRAVVGENTEPRTTQQQSTFNTTSYAGSVASSDRNRGKVVSSSLLMHSQRGP